MGNNGTQKKLNIRFALQMEARLMEWKHAQEARRDVYLETFKHDLLETELVELKAKIDEGIGMYVPRTFSTATSTTTTKQRSVTEAKSAELKAFSESLRKWAVEELKKSKRQIAKDVEDSSRMISEVERRLASNRECAVRQKDEIALAVIAQAEAELVQMKAKLKLHAHLTAFFHDLKPCTFPEE